MKSPDQYLLRPDHIVSLHGIEFPLEYLYRGLLAVGQPGSGKTRCILLPLLESILKATGSDPGNKCGLVVIDPKNELENYVVEMLRRVGREEDLLVLKPGRATYNPLTSPFLSQAEMPEKIIAWANNTHRSAQRQAMGESEFWSNATRALLTALVAATRAIHGTLTFPLLDAVFRRIERFDSAASATVWMDEKHVPENAIRGISDYLSLPRDTTRPCVTSCVSDTLYFWSSEPLASLITPSASVPEIDPFAVIDQGKILIVGCAAAAYGSSITPLLLALKEHCFAALLSRDQVDVQEKGEWKLMNQTRPVLVVADEFQSYLSVDPSTGELIALDRLRGFKSGMICATQNLASLHSVLGHADHATRLISLFANQIFLSNICPYTARQAEYILGEKETRDRQREFGARTPAPALFRSTKRVRPRAKEVGVEIIRTEPRVTAATLAKMKTGEFWIRLANGKVVRKKAAQLHTI